jgi:tRNA(fMet)-specific endonuclease VapC
VSQYILDTDHVSLILLNHAQVTATAAQEQIAVTIITVQELFNGWVGRINNPSQVSKSKVSCSLENKDRLIKLSL